MPPTCSNCGASDFVWANDLKTGAMGGGALSLRNRGELSLGTRICRACGHADLFLKDPSILKMPHTWRPGEFVPITPKPSAPVPAPEAPAAPPPVVPDVPAPSPPPEPAAPASMETSAVESSGATATEAAVPADGGTTEPPAPADAPKKGGRRRSRAAKAPEPPTEL